MNQKELIDRINESTLVDKKLVANVLTCLGNVVASELAEGGEITLPHIGKLSVATRAARTGRNPSTGEKIEIGAKRVPHFSAAKALKDAVRG